MPGEAQDDPFALVGHTLEGKFRVEAAVAEGGFGVVYRATHLTLDVPVALKLLKRPMKTAPGEPDFVEGFEREARTIARLRHPDIVQVLDYGVSTMPNGESVAWMALEWLAGQTLDVALRDPGRARGMTPAQVMAVMRGALEALGCAHDAGIAHRDIKPSNFMLVAGRRGETLRLLDFGIAKVMDADAVAGSGATATTSTNVSCSPRYAAPEQFSRGRTGPWTDVHAVALVLTEMLTGRPPYNSDSVATLCFDALRERRPSPAAFDVDVGAWEPVLLRALELRGVHRYPNASALLAALDEALPGATHRPLPPSTTAPDGASPPPPGTGARRRLRPAALAVAAALGVAAFALVAGRAHTTPAARPPQVRTAVAPPAVASPAVAVTPVGWPAAAVAETASTAVEPPPAPVVVAPPPVHRAVARARHEDVSPAAAAAEPAATPAVEAIDAGRPRYRVE